MQPGNYDIIIEWKGLGINSDGLYVCWLPDSIATNSISSDALPSFVKDGSYNVSFKFERNDVNDALPDFEVRNFTFDNISFP